MMKKKPTPLSPVTPHADREEALADYVLAHISPEDEYLHRLYRATQTQLLYPRMASGHLQGRLLRMLMQMIRPNLVLELGTFSGYSALAMASGMEAGGRVITFEVNDEQEDFTRPWLEAAPYEARVEMIVGDAAQVLPTLGMIFDVAFIDANKRDYCDYFELVLPYLRPGGFLIADNTLWDGHVVDAAYDRDAQTLGIRAFNDLVAHDPRVETVILPLRDGLTLIRKIV